MVEFSELFDCEVDEFLKKAKVNLFGNRRTPGQPEPQKLWSLRLHSSVVKSFLKLAAAVDWGFLWYNCGMAVVWPVLC